MRGIVVVLALAGCGSAPSTAPRYCESVAVSTLVGFPPGMGQPFGIAVDGDGNLLVGFGCRVMKVAPDGGTQTTLNGSAPCGDSRPSDKFDDLLYGVTVDDSRNVLVTDWWNGSIHTIAPDGTSTTLPATFHSPGNIAVDHDSNVYVVEYNADVRKIAADGTVSTVAEGLLTSPESLTIDDAGNLYVADNARDVIVRVAPDGSAMTAAGVERAGSNSDQYTPPPFTGPIAVARDAGGALFVASDTPLVRVAPSGAVDVVVAGGSHTNTDGNGCDAGISVGGIALSGRRLYVADPLSLSIRVVQLP